MKITDQHLKALARAESFMSQGITNAMSQKHQDFVRTDIARINEVRALVRSLIKEPGLPLQKEE